MKDKKRFKDDLDTYVITNRFVLYDNFPITFISHDEDGDWQFIGGTNFTEQDARVISLQEMIAHDPSILDMADLPLGFKAERESIGKDWQIGKLEVK